MLAPVYIDILTKLIKNIPRDNRGVSDIKPVQHYIDKIFYVMETGIPWRKLIQTKEDLHYTTYHKKFLHYCKYHIFQTAHQIILKLIHQKKLISTKDLYIDATMIKNIKGIDHIGPNFHDRGKNGSKISIIVTKEGIPLGISFSKSNVADINLTVPTIDDIKIRIANSRLIADKGYVCKKTTQELKDKYKIRLITPVKLNQRKTKSLTKTDRKLLSTRNIVENFFSWIKSNRRIQQRYDKFMFTYKEFTYLALIKIISLKIKL